MSSIKNTNTNTPKQSSKINGHNQVSEDSPFCSKTKIQRSPIRGTNTMLGYLAREGDKATSKEEIIRRNNEVKSPLSSEARRLTSYNDPVNTQKITNVVNTNTRKENVAAVVNDTTNSTEERRHLNRLKQDEESAFIELGNKLSIANGIVSSAKNIHKILRDSLNSAFALYQQLREHREAINVNPINVTNTTIGQSKQSKAVQVEMFSPMQERKRKIPKTPATEALIQTQGEAKELTTPVTAIEWKTAKRRKDRKKELNKQHQINDQGDAITIKTSTKESYADIIKEMKKKINPTDIGVDIQCIRRTRTGVLLVKLKKGEGQAEKLKSAIGNTLGDDVQIKTVTKNEVIDIRDMDESTDNNDIVNALMEATQIEEPTMFKVLNIRTSYGNTKQALVQVPAHIAATLLDRGKIRIGWIMCKVKMKIRITQCFRCLEQGHIATQCKNADRSNLCRRCCKPGHKYKECDADISCILCHEKASLNVNHYIGSTTCIQNRATTANL